MKHRLVFAEDLAPGMLLRRRRQPSHPTDRTMMAVLSQTMMKPPAPEYDWLPVLAVRRYGQVVSAILQGTEDEGEIGMTVPEWEQLPILDQFPTLPDDVGVEHFEMETPE